MCKLSKTGVQMEKMFKLEQMTKLEQLFRLESLFELENLFELEKKFEMGLSQVISGDVIGRVLTIRACAWYNVSCRVSSGTCRRAFHPMEPLGRLKIVV